jgi:uncharacterized protein
MRRVLYFFMMMAMALALPAGAQDASTAQREKLARLAIEKARVSATMEQVGVQMVAALDPLMRQDLIRAGVAQENLEKALGIYRRKMSEELAGPAFREQLIDATAKDYAREFDEAELRALIAFFDSPAGRKMIERQPQLMQRSMALGQRLGEERGRRAGEAAFKELRQLGLAPASKGK